MDPRAFTASSNTNALSLQVQPWPGDGLQIKLGLPWGSSPCDWGARGKRRPGLTKSTGQEGEEDGHYAAHQVVIRFLLTSLRTRGDY